MMYFSIELSFPEELLSYGLSEEVLKATFYQVCDGLPVSWKLTSIPTVGFYQELHCFLKHWPLTSKVSKHEIALFYMAIDAKLKAKGSRPDNIYRFIDNLSKIPSDQVMYYGTQGHTVRQLKSDVGQCTQKLEEMTSEYTELKKQFKESKRKLQSTEKVLRDVTNQRGTMKRSRDYAKAMLFKSQRKFESLEGEYADILMENIDLTDILSEKDDEYLQSLIPSECVKQGKAYPPAIRKLYYSLLTKQIPASKVAEIIKTVLKTFAPSVDVENLPLPQKACASYMRKEELVTICSAHKATVLSEAAAKSSGFHLNTDGTTKNQKKIGGVVVNGMVVSLNELSDGTALSAVDDISRELEKLRATAASLGIPNANSINWTLLVCSTSDSASTQKKVNKLIKERRDADEREFGAATIDTIELIENFCSMHLGINLRKAFLAGIDDGDDPCATSRKYNCVDTLVHEFCKLFGAHGTPEYACGAQSFPDFLELMSQSGNATHNGEYFRSCANVTLHRQVGSRYFVSASNASKIIHLKDAAISFLTFTGKDEVGNRLEKEVYSKLHDPLELAALRADALIYYHAYADLVMLSKSNDLGKSALDMNIHYVELQVFLSEVKDNVEVIFNKSREVFVSEKRLYGSSKNTNHQLKKDMHIVVNSLFNVPEIEMSSLKSFLRSGASTMLDKLSSYAENQLPGGIYWEPDESIKKALSQLKPSNDVCESVLGLNDYLTTALPNLAQVSRSNLVQMKKNKTLEWLDTLPQQQQNSIVDLAVQRRKQVLESCKEDAKERATKRQQNLMQTHTRREALKTKKLAEKEKLIQHHLISSPDELFDAIAQLEAANSTAAKRKSATIQLIKTQINIRKKVLNQNIRIIFSHARQQRPLSQVIEELSVFISENTPFMDILQNPEGIVGSQVNHQFVIDGQTKWFTGTIISYNASTKTHELAYNEEEEHCNFDLSIDIANGDIEIVTLS